ncbi:MAG: hypothetical protein H0T62_09355 [Parachlamydiaceae bacterium]|nr:hypothetical protein [Parachlamydiaceae bacterium]
MKWQVSHAHKRHLATLVQENRLLIKGATRSGRYQLLLPQNNLIVNSAVPMEKESEHRIPLSALAEIIRKKVPYSGPIANFLISIAKPNEP